MTVFGSKTVTSAAMPGARKPRSTMPIVLAESLDDERAHLLDVVGSCAAIRRSHHVRPRGVETDVAADIDGESCCARARELLREVRRAAAVGVDDLGGHALREHVLRCGQRCRRRVAVDVDEAGRDVEAGDVFPNATWSRSENGSTLRSPPPRRQDLHDAVALESLAGQIAVETLEFPI